MQKPYAELRLYCGGCPIPGMLGEGRFYPSSSDSINQERLSRATQMVNNTLRSLYIGCLSFYNAGDDENLVPSEEEARKIIDFAESRFPNACGVVEPYNVMHGRIDFVRKLRIYGVTEDDRDELIRQLKQPGAITLDREKEQTMLHLKCISGLYKEREAPTLQQLLKERGLDDEDRVWNASLKFFG